MMVQRRFRVLIGVCAFVLMLKTSSVWALEVMKKQVTYAERDGLKLTIDLFLPENDSAKRPAILWFHGGGWRGGNPKQFFPQSEALAKLGIVCGSVRYRLSGEAPFPACLEDCKASVRYLRAHAEEFGVDPTKIGVGGGSAGGHLAAMVGLTPGNFEGDAPYADRASTASLMILFNAPTDMRPLGEYEAIKKLLAEKSPTDERLGEISPVTYVSKDSPPALILHGTADTTVPVIHAQFLHRKLRGAKVTSRMVLTEGAAHGWFNRGKAYEETLAEVQNFLRQRSFLPASEGAKR